MKDKILIGGGQHRDSSIELFRIITMLCIIAHHYIVNSEILEEITRQNILTHNSLFSLLFGCGGKTGINCFVLITGYFMCESNISAKKFLKLFIEIEFYKAIFYLAFAFSGYTIFSLKEFTNALIPMQELGGGFVDSYLVFYLFIPYLNLLIKSMNKMHHLVLIMLCFLSGTILQTFLKASTAFTYVGWFMVLYFVGSYIRLYPKKSFQDRKICGISFLISLVFSWASVFARAWIYAEMGIRTIMYQSVDINRIFAVSTAVSGFLFFKSLHLKYCAIINKFAASAFGVLLIHANSDMMRQWLWQDILRNVQVYQSNYLVIHAIASVISIYIICALIDMVRIKLLEKPFFYWYDRFLDRKLISGIQNIGRLLRKEVQK